MSRVEIYYNIRKKVFSLRQNGRVFDRATSILIRDPRFVVQESRRQKVIRNKRKNVHAFVVANTRDDVIFLPDFDGLWNLTAGVDHWPYWVSYNPYAGPDFMAMERDIKSNAPPTPVTKAPYVLMFIDPDIQQPYMLLPR